MTASARSARSEQRFGWACLAWTFCLGLVTIYWGRFTDEADNLVVGGLMAQGALLYRDVFSHHFPFPYYWMAGVIDLTGRSIFTARLSLLCFQIAVLAVGMTLSGYYRIVGAVVLIWSVTRPFYRSNLVLYSSFAGPALLALFLIVMALVQGRKSATWRHWTAIGILALIALLSDPLSIYGVGIALAFLLLSDWTSAFKAGAIVAGGGALYAGYLLANDALPAFWENAIHFNAAIYARYIDAGSLRSGALLRMAATGLEIGDRAWFDLDPFKPLLGRYTELDSWFFTGFLYRLAILAATLLLVLRRQLRAAAFLYLFAAAMAVMDRWEFRAQPFVLTALAAIVIVIGEGWRRHSGTQLQAVIARVLGVGVLLATVWLCIRLTTAIFYNLETQGRAQLASFQTEAAAIHAAACHQPGVALAYYPDGSYWHWFTEMEPVAGYLFMWPWMAEVGLEDVVAELAQAQTLAVVIVREGSVWGLYDTNEYLRPLNDFLQEAYLQTDDGIYISPALAARCAM